MTEKVQWAIDYFMYMGYRIVCSDNVATKMVGKDGYVFITPDGAVKVNRNNPFFITAFDHTEYFTPLIEKYKQEQTKLWSF